MGLKKQNPGCTCCGCVYESDNFDRADNTDIGAKWTEEAGAWSIASNKLSTTGTSAIALLAATHAKGSANITVEYEGSDDDLIRVGVNWVDADNYHFAEFKLRASGGSPYIRLYERVAGVNTQLVETVTAVLLSGTLTVCFTNGVFSAWPGTTFSGSSASYLVPTPSAPRQVFLGTGGTVSSDVTFDNFVAERGYDPDTDPDCPQCFAGTCDECGAPPASLTISAAGWPDNTVVKDHVFFGDLPCFWFSEEDVDEAPEFSPGCVFFHQLQRFAGGLWELTVATGDGICNGSGTYQGTAVYPTDCTETVTLTLVPGTDMTCCEGGMPATFQVN